jgi:hypothetical protein
LVRLAVVVVVVDGDEAEPLPLLVPPLEPVALPVVDPVAVVVESLVLVEEVEEVEAFACARNLAPPQASAAQTIPIAIFRLTRSWLSRTLIVAFSVFALSDFAC